MPESESIREGMNRPLISGEKLFWIFILLAVLFSGNGLYKRLKVEWAHRTVAIVVDYKDLISLSKQAGEDPANVYRQLAERGTQGITVAEFSGKDLSSGAMPLVYGALASFPESARSVAGQPLDRGALLVDEVEPLLPAMLEYLKIRMPGLLQYGVGKQRLIVLPATTEELGDSGLLPDFGALAFAERVGAVSLYRPAPAFGLSGEQVGASVTWLKNRYPSVSCVIPAGLIIAGYPDVAPFAKALKEAKISVGQAEFIRQIGAAQLYSAMKPDIVPLHSLVRDELISRRMGRGQVVERMVRAVHERSIRIILMRPYDLYSTGKLPLLLEDMQKIHDSLRSKGYRFGWPESMPLLGTSLLSALGVASIFVVCLWSYVRRYLGRGLEMVSYAEAGVLFACILILGVAIWKVSAVSRLAGAFAAAFAATEATLWALDRYKKTFAGLVAGLLIVLAGGLSIATFYGTTVAMLRLAPFSGVKLTLLLPPLLILVSDLKRRIHPESFSEILKRPPLWGELLLCGMLLVGALLLTVRSDNVAFVPGWEIRFRDMLERLLWVRPRTKEFLVGYPCLVIYYALIRRGWAVHYREVFRIGASLAFASAVNTFCHFHTLLPLTVVRVVNGWWLGILVGFVAVVALEYIGGPIWRKGGRELFD